MIKHDHSKHEFALYCKELSALLQQLSCGDTFSLPDKDLCLRIASILRLTVGERLVLFDRYKSSTVSVHEISKKSVVVTIQNINNNVPVSPAITFALPVLKRDDFEAAIYSLVELSATIIQPVVTQKVQRVWGGAKEQERIERIIIAAAEQSKNFAIPEFKEPVLFSSFVDQQKLPVIFFDPLGMSFTELLPHLVKHQQRGFTLMVGPEGDLTAQEKDQLRAKNALFSQLTPTVLRSCQAVAVGLGVVRALVR